MLSDSEIKFAKNLSQSSTKLSATAELLNICNYLGINNKLTRDQLYYKNNKLDMINNDASSAKNSIHVQEQK